MSKGVNKLKKENFNEIKCLKLISCRALNCHCFWNRYFNFLLKMDVLLNFNCSTVIFDLVLEYSSADFVFCCYLNHEVFCFEKKNVSNVNFFNFCVLHILGIVQLFSYSFSHICSIYIATKKILCTIVIFRPEHLIAFLNCARTDHCNGFDRLNWPQRPMNMLFLRFCSCHLQTNDVWLLNRWLWSSGLGVVVMRLVMVHQSICCRQNVNLAVMLTHRPAMLMMVIVATLDFQPEIS